MGHTVWWTQNSFSNFTYNIVISICQKIIDNDVGLNITKEWFSIGTSDDDSIYILKNGGCTFYKTDRMSYTNNVMKVLIIMVEYGAAINLAHNHSDMIRWIDALNEVHALVPLASYQLQKNYFTSYKQTSGELFLLNGITEMSSPYVIVPSIGGDHQSSTVEPVVVLNRCVTVSSELN
jgi:hypothetical protein